MLHLLEQLILGHIMEDKRRKKPSSWQGFKPTTSLLQGEHSNAVLQPLPRSLFINGNSIPVWSVGGKNEQHALKKTSENSLRIVHSALSLGFELATFRLNVRLFFKAGQACQSHGPLE